MKKKFKDLKDKPSEYFELAVRSSGTNLIDCELCGRVHFASAEGGFEPGELERLLRNEKRNPEKYVNHGDSLCWGYIDGKQAVIGCPCNRLSAYEKFIWRHRRIIAEYLKERSKAELELATMEAENLASLNVT